MKRSLRGLLWIFSIFSVVLAVQPARADVLFAVRVLREEGCGGTLPPAPPLHRNPLLDRSAEEWAAGRGLSQAVELSGYHAASTAGLHVRGPDDAMLQLLKRSGCGTLASQGLHEMGLYRRGFDVWIVLATGHELTAESRGHEPSPPAQAPEALARPEGRTPVSAESTARAEVAAHPPTSASSQVGATANALPRTSQAVTSQVPAAELPEDAAVPAPAPDAVAAAVPAPSRSSKPAVPPPVAKSALSPILATRALQLVNDVRARGTRCGSEVFGPAPPVTLSPTLAGVAFGHASDMAQNNYFEHSDLHGNTPSDRVRATGYQETLVGENIAYGPKTVDEVVQGWLDSPGHCENIMDPRFAEMGLGYATSYDSKHRLYWVQVLATPRKVASR